jgi:hypothetical protein
MPPYDTNSTARTARTTAETGGGSGSRGRRGTGRGQGRGRGRHEGGLRGRGPLSTAIHMVMFMQARGRMGARWASSSLRWMCWG